MEKVLKNKFYQDVFSKEFPKIRLVNKRRLNEREFRTVGLSYRSLLISKEAIDDCSDEILTEILAHEYLHLRDRKRYSTILFRILYSLPQIIMPVIAYLAIYNANTLLTLLAFLFCLPVWPIFRCYAEFRAYAMTLVVRVCFYNNERPLPKSWQELFVPTDMGMREITEHIFSKAYYSNFTPQFIRDWYYKRMRWFVIARCKEYFNFRLAFESKSSYIIRHKDPYSHVLYYLTTNGLKSV